MTLGGGGKKCDRHLLQAAPTAELSCHPFFDGFATPGYAVAGRIKT